MESVGGVYLTPMELGSIGQGMLGARRRPTRDAADASSNPSLNYLSATPDYFKAMRIPLMRGRRVYRRTIGANAPRVAIISESTAAALFPGQDPIGKRIKAASFSTDPKPEPSAWRTIVGVVGNVRYRGLERGPARYVRPADADTHGRRPAWWCA